MAERMTNRRRQALEMKARIQSEALRLFDKKGFEAVSMEEIAEAAGCSAGNIYNYFSGKQALTAALTHHVDSKYQSLMERYTDESCKLSACAKLIDYMGEALRIDSEEELLYQCFIHSIKHPESRVLQYDADEVYFQLVKRLAGELFKENEIREGVAEEDIVHQFCVINRGLLLQWRIEEMSFDIAAEGRRMIANILYGVIR